MLAGQEAITYIIRIIDKKRQLTASGEPISIRWADDLNKSVDFEDVNRIPRKFQPDDKILKVLALLQHSVDHAWELKLNARFEQYHDQLRKTKTYQDFTGQKPKSSTRKLAIDLVDFRATPDENHGKHISIDAISGFARHQSSAERVV